MADGSRNITAKVKTDLYFELRARLQSAKTRLAVLEEEKRVIDKDLEAQRKEVSLCARRLTEEAAILPGLFASDVAGICGGIIETAKKKL